ncbi:peptidase [Mycolicibacterium parafortuitum]|uniref:peptidase n=1 Tax=Mycolicibacterium parafortuitum TaxID=39692 RepID=UPI0009F5036B|nr:peptidase [Mycolicibacterium parafortuitum]ORB27578.1 peptidase [Mycolicibacterium parafortuitum]
MRRSTTSVVTRPALGAVLGAELICAVLLVAGPSVSSPGPAVAAPTPLTQTVAAAPMSRGVPLPDGRTAVLADLGARDGAALLDRIAAELPGAVAAVTGFWGDRWPREIPIVVAATAGQFATLAGGGADIAATTTTERITFSPAAAAMNDADLRTVLRHELFHFAARADTAADAPVWLTEGVADYVGRPPAPVPPGAPTALPTDAELATPGPGRSAAYDRAWEFASYIAHTYGPDKLRALYVAACGPGHRDVATAVRTALGVDPSTLTAAP